MVRDSDFTAVEYASVGHTRARQDRLVSSLVTLFWNIHPIQDVSKRYTYSLTATKWVSKYQQILPQEAEVRIWTHSYFSIITETQGHNRNLSSSINYSMLSVLFND